jgi:hypothetical protein
VLTAAPPGAFLLLSPFFRTIGDALFLLRLRFPRFAYTTRGSPREPDTRAAVDDARKPSGRTCVARQLIARHADMMPDAFANVGDDDDNQLKPTPKKRFGHAKRNFSPPRRRGRSVLPR